MEKSVQRGAAGGQTEVLDGAQRACARAGEEALLRPRLPGPGEEFRPILSTEVRCHLIFQTILFARLPVSLL